MCCRNLLFPALRSYQLCVTSTKVSDVPSRLALVCPWESWEPPVVFNWRLESLPKTHNRQCHSQYHSKVSRMSSYSEFVDSWFSMRFKKETLEWKHDTKDNPYLFSMTVCTSKINSLVNKETFFYFYILWLRLVGNFIISFVWAGKITVYTPTNYGKYS